MTFLLSRNQAKRLQQIVKRYKPELGKCWRDCTDDELWLRVLSQIVVAGNAAPGYILLRSEAAQKTLSFSKLKKLSSHHRRKLIHSVMHAIGTRYVGKSSRNRKIDAALDNFDVLEKAGGPKRFFKGVAAIEPTAAKIKFLRRNFAFYRKKSCRDTLIELGLAYDCIALDQRLKKILRCVGARVPNSVNKSYDRIEKELIERVAKPCHLSGGELDRILFQNSGDIMVRLACKCH